MYKKTLFVIATVIMIYLTCGMAFAAQSSSLTSLEPFEACNINTDCVLLDGKDRYGSIYTACLGPRDDTGYIEYLLNCEYSSLQTALYVTGADLNPYYDYYWDYVTCRIYGDDQLLFSITGINPKAEPRLLNIDVNGVRFLRIEFDKAAYFNTGAGRPLVLLGNPMLLRAMCP